MHLRGTSYVTPRTYGRGSGMHAYRYHRRYITHRRAKSAASRDVVLPIGHSANPYP